MFDRTSMSAVALVAAALVWGMGPGVALAQGDDHGHKPGDGHDHGKEEGHAHHGTGEHGGVLTSTKEFEVEAVFHVDSVEVYLFTQEDRPLTVEGLGGSVKVSFTDKARPAVEAPLAAAVEADGEHEHEG